MATIVLNLDLEQFSSPVSVPERYDQALILIWLGGRPVGQARLPVVQGEIKADLPAALLEAGDWPLWEAWLHDYLAWSELGQAPAAPALDQVTVAVCTRDRPEDLEACLEALLRLPDEGQELLVIDNCPATEATRRLVAGYERVRYVREDRPGLNNARNRALAEARGEVVAFTDDDARPDPGWLKALIRNFDDSLVYCVTGLTMPLELETEAQERFERYSSFGRGFRRKVFDSANHNPLVAGPVGAGVNMALRRRVVAEVGPFDAALDAGTPTRSGGDNEMFTRILAAGYRIVYEPAALNWHRHRRIWSELRQAFYGYGVGVYAAWTRSLLVEGEWGVFRPAWGWFRYQQLPALARSLLRRSGRMPLDLILAELRGCLAGPGAYLRSRRQAGEGSPPRHGDAGATVSYSRHGDAGATVSYSRHGDAGNTVSYSRYGLEGNSPAPVISVIIPTHNRQAVLRRTLEALANQTYPLSQLEVVVVADACTDGTVEMLHSYPAPFRLQASSHSFRSAAASRNYGAGQAKGRLLLFLDDDVEPTPALVEAHVRAHEARPGQVVMGPYRPLLPGRLDFFHIDLRAWWEDKFREMARPGPRYTYRDLLSGNLSLEAELYARLGGFDQAFQSCGGEDYEFGLRLLKQEAPFHFAPEALAWHHEQSDLDRSLQRRRQEGRADVLMGQRHPELRPRLALANFEEPGSRLSRFMRRLAFAWPAGGDALAAWLRSRLDRLERRQLRGRWRKLNSSLRNYWYWRGVAEEIGSRPALAVFLREAGPEPERPEFELDLSRGLAAAQAKLDRQRPAGAYLYYGRQPVAHLVPAAGIERLRGAHLRPMLATKLATPLLQAMALAEAGETPEVRLRLAPQPPLSFSHRLETETGPTALEKRLQRMAVDKIGWDLVPVRLGRQFQPEPPGSGSLPPVSVVVCTRNRTAQLKTCLETLLALDYPEYEIIVVDNAPDNEDTANLAAGLPVRYVREERPGLDWARNRGLLEARYKVVAYTDDDARPDRGWLRAMGQAFARPEVMAVTGLALPAELDTLAQIRFELIYGGMGRGLYRRTMQRERLARRELLWASAFGVGANMAFRRELFDRIGLFDVALDVGTPSGGGGDNEMFHRVVARGYTLVYEPAALVWHQHRGEDLALRRLVFNNGRSFGAYLMTCWRNRTVERGAVFSFAVREWLGWWLLRRLVRPRGLPRHLVAVELGGALFSPLAYYQARVQARRVAAGPVERAPARVELVSEN